MKRKDKKIKYFVALLLLLTMMLTFGSCGGEVLAAKSFDVVLNKDYESQEKIVEDLVEIKELEGYSFSEAKGEFMSFTKIENDATISKAVFNTKSKKVVYVGNSTVDVGLDVKLASGVSAFTVVKTQIVEEDGVTDIKSVCELYDATGAYVAQASGEAVLPIAFADTVIFDNVAYSVNAQSGTFSKIADVFELIYADGCEDWNEEYFCTYGDEINLYNKNFERIYSYTLPSEAKLISRNMFNNGNVILQYGQPLDADAEKYDFSETDEINGVVEKFELHSILINAKNKSEKEIKLDYIIEQVTSGAELARAQGDEKIYSDGVENIAYVYPLGDGIIDYSEKSADVVLMNNKGKIEKSLKIVEEQRAALPMSLGNDVYMVSTFYGYALIDIDGNVLNKIENAEIDVYGNNIIIADAIYTFGMEEVYKLDEHSEILGYYGKKIVIRQGTDEKYTVFTIEGNAKENLYEYSAGSEITVEFDFFENSACYARCSDMTSEYIYFNADNKNIGGLSLRLKKVASDFGNGITVYKTEFDGNINYYTIY